MSIETITAHTLMKRHKITGLSLIELLITLSILSLSLVLIVPLATFYAREQTKNDATRLFHNLQFARHSAIRAQQPITVCGSNNGKQCSTDWSQGYIIFSRNKKQKIRILRYERPMHASIHSYKLKEIRFLASGGTNTRGTILIKTSNYSQKIIIYDSGRIRIAQA